MALAPATAANDKPNHPNAVWMAAIAWLSHNMVVGCLMGSFSVMRGPVSHITGAKDALVALAGPLLLAGSALAGVVSGDLIARFPLRRLMLITSALGVIGFLILAFNTSYAVYIAVYIALFGPGMSICGSVGPATLVTRWFNRHRGLALGLVHVNLIVALMPLLCVWLLGSYGPKVVYQMMAALIGLTLIPSLFFIGEHPPGDALSELTQPEALGAQDALSLGQIVTSSFFWRVALPFGMLTTSVMVLTFTMVQIVTAMGYTPGEGAGLQAVMSFSGMLGSIVFGWVADKLGGVRGMALLAVDFAIVMGLLMLKLPLPALTFVMFLAGLHGAGMVPNTGRAFADRLGTASFSRAFGLAGSVSLPITAAAVVGISMVAEKTGSYAAGFAVLAVLLLLMAPLVLSAGGRQAAASAKA